MTWAFSYPTVGAIALLYTKLLHQIPFNYNPCLFGFVHLLPGITKAILPIDLEAEREWTKQ